jgi:hypothetical protein
MSPCSAHVRKAVPLPWTSQGVLYGIQSIKIGYFQEYIFGEHLNCCSLILACDTSHGLVLVTVKYERKVYHGPSGCFKSWGDVLERIDGLSGTPAVGPGVVLVSSVLVSVLLESRRTPWIPADRNDTVNHSGNGQLWDRRCAIYLLGDPSSGARSSKYASQKRKDSDARVRVH